MINNDFELVQALLKHDEVVTREFFYKKCYPLFKSVYDNYHTDCSSCIEFINEIYIHLLSPNVSGSAFIPCIIQKSSNS